MASILFERGKSTSTQNTVKDGKITYKTDTSELYFDVGNQRQEINANNAKTVGGESLNTIKTGYQNYINEKISPITAKLDYTNIAYGTCATAADVATKEVTLNSNVSHWEQEIGSLIAIKFDISNTASNVTIKVGNNDAYPIWYNNTEYTGTGTAYTGYADRLIVYMFNGTHWVWITSSYDSNTTYTNEKLGNGYGTCSTAESTTAKKATFSSYTLVKHGMVSIKFTYNVPANATLNINSKGAKNIYYRGAKIIANIIKAGDIATFVYDGTQYQLIAIDRWQNDIDALTTNLSQLSNTVDTKAPKESPTLTGTPTAPTAAAGTNTTQIATTAFVQTAVSNRAIGPDTSTNAHVAIFDGDNTKKIKDSGFTIAANVPAGAKFTDTTYGLVSETTAGLMSPDQKNKLDYIDANANKYVLPNAGTTLGGVKSGGDVTISNGIITVNDDSHNHTISNIDDLQDKLDAIDNAFDETVEGPSSSVAEHIAVFADNTGKTIKDSGFTIGKSVPSDAKFTDTTYSAATTSAAGLMSASDKAKLNNIDSNANNYTLPNAGTTLGGVKSGGDVAISNGVITIIDNSHNHTISNIDELQDKLDLKAPLVSPALTGTPTAPTATASTNNTQIATTAFVKTAINNLLGASAAMTFKGSIGTGGDITTLPASHDVGDTYVVKTAGSYAGQTCEIGDMIICITSGTTATNSHWTVIQTNINGAVTGPSSSVTNRVAVFNGTTGKVIKDSGFTIGKSVPSDAKFTDTIYTLPIADEDTLGGVKEGGDIAIDSDGIMTVKDDSHNHVISNVDGLQDKFDAIDNAFDATVDGPSNSTENHVATFADSTGKTIKDSGFTIGKSVPSDAKFTDTVYTLPVAKTDVLGGVKAGGDIDISSSGVMTVKDDSHNHVIGNVDGLQNELNEKANKNAGIFYIEGAGTTDTTNKVATWTGTHNDITSYYEGLMIAYKIGTAGSTTTTLNINNLGAITVVKNNTTAISTNFPVNAVIFLVYTLDGETAYWKAHDYDANTRNSVGDYRKNSTKLYLAGTTSSDASSSSSYATSYTNSYCYIGTDNCLYAYHAGNAKSEKVAFAPDLTSLQNQINEKAPLNSPDFIGDPKAPTPPKGDNDTSIATTAFVQTAISDRVIGPSTSTDAHIVVFDGATGKKIKDSSFTIGKSVPSNAKFTDTTYGLVTDTAAGLMSSDQKNKLDYIEAEANKYVLPSAGSALGGVKSGGDVTIADGVITVKDDSHNHVISNIDGLQNELNEKASLDSPAFTGNPTAPTPAVTDNDTSIATTAFVQAAINNTLSNNFTLSLITENNTSYNYTIYGMKNS